ncbi:hypothetical protein STEG23_029290, partial [Scotinomys teguina]
FRLQRMSSLALMESSIENKKGKELSFASLCRLLEKTVKADGELRNSPLGNRDVHIQTLIRVGEGVHVLTHKQQLDDYFQESVFPFTRFIWFIASVSSSVSLFSFCLDDLSIGKSEILNCPRKEAWQSKRTVNCPFPDPRSALDESRTRRSPEEPVSPRQSVFWVKPGFTRILFHGCSNAAKVYS